MFCVNPVSQIFSPSMINETSADRSAAEIRKSRLNLADDLQSDFKNELKNVSGFYQGLQTHDFLAMLQSSLQPVSTRPEIPIDRQHNTERDANPEFNEKISSPLQDRDQNPAAEKMESKNSETINAETKNTKNEKPEKSDEKFKTANLKSGKTNHALALDKNHKTGQISGNEKNDKSKLENNASLSPKDLKELLVKDSKPLFQKKEVVKPENLFDKNMGKTGAQIGDLAGNSGAEKTKISLFDKLHAKTSVRQTGSEKNLLEAGKFDKTDKTSKTNFLKHRNDQATTTSGETKTADQLVSRETISLATSDKKQTFQNENLSSRGLGADKTSGSSLIADQLKTNLKSNLDSESSTGQQHGGYSTHSAERFNFMSKVDDNPVLRSNLQQQIDQMLQKAKVIIRDNGNAQLSTKLNPRELGEISIKLTLVNGKLTGKFTVDNDFVQKELSSKLDKIFAELKTEGYVVDGFQVDVKSQTGNENNFNETMLNSANRETNGFRLNAKQENRIANFQSIDLDNLEKRGEIYA